MPDYNGTTSQKTQQIVFVTNSAHTLWIEDPDFPYSTERFLADCAANGFPIWRVRQTAYVFASGEWPE